MKQFAEREQRPKQREEREPIVQAKLQVGAATDPLEAEADRTAYEVVLRLAQQATGPRSIPNSDRIQAKPKLSGDSTETSRQAQNTNHLQRSTHTAEVGLGGGDVSPEVSNRIQRARGNGLPLSTPVRDSMEGAFGADFSSVRIHTGVESTQLNRSVNAKAFTVGNDVFFSENEYKPNTTSGQHLLAHELTHTIQQGGATVKRRTASDETGIRIVERAGTQDSIQRLAVAGTQWDKTKTVTVLSAGASGNVAKFSDGKSSVIVKANQEIAPEVLLAGGLLDDALGDKVDGFKGVSPAVRIATGAEMAQINVAVNKRIPKDKDGNPDKNNARNFLENLGKSHTLIMEAASGRNFKLLMANDKHTKKSGFGGRGPRQLRKDSPITQMTSSPGPMTILGRVVAADVLMGMYDRLVSSVNLDNFMYDSKKKTFSFVDNTHNTDAGTLVTRIFEQGMFGSVGTMEVSRPRTGFDSWLQHGTYVNDLVEKPTTLATTVWDGLFGANTPLKGEKRHGGVRDEDRDPVMQAITANKAVMIGWLTTGITQGRDSVVARCLDPKRLVRCLPAEHQHDAFASMYARGKVLAGVSANDAWSSGLGAAVASLGPRPTQLGWPEIMEWWEERSGLDARSLSEALDNPGAGGLSRGLIYSFLDSGSADERAARIKAMAKAGGLELAEMEQLFPTR